MSGPFYNPPMTQQQYAAELMNRGFHYDETRKEWVGPFGITATGVANISNYYSTNGRDNPMGIGNSGLTGGGVGPGVSGLRKSILAEIDEKLRAKRGLPYPGFRIAPPPGQ